MDRSPIMKRFVESIVHNARMGSRARPPTDTIFALWTGRLPWAAGQMDRHPRSGTGAACSCRLPFWQRWRSLGSWPRCLPCPRAGRPDLPYFRCYAAQRSGWVWLRLCLFLQAFRFFHLLACALRKSWTAAVRLRVGITVRHQWNTQPQKQRL